MVSMPQSQKLSTLDRPTPNRRRKLNGSSTRPMLPSSLPPPSSPSASSRPFIDRFIHDVQPIPPSPPENLEPDKVQGAFADASSHTDLDPFGFFALENKLKILRSHQQLLKPRHQTTSLPQTTTPLTPSKKCNEQETTKSPTPSGKGSSGPSPTPSTPSRKPISSKGKGRAIAEDKPNPEDDDTLETLASSLKPTRRRRNAKGASGAKESGNSSQRYSLQQTDPAVKPRKGVSRGRMRDEDRYASVAEVVVKTTRQKPRVKRPAKPTNDTNKDVKKWEEERQARLDYFKKLEDYQLEKENVYVV